MPEWEAIGLVVVVLSTLLGLFSLIHKPINENTKALTTLTIKLDQVKESLGTQQDAFESFKTHVSISQQKQWDVINDHSDMLLKYGIEIEQLKGGRQIEE